MSPISSIAFHASVAVHRRVDRVTSPWSIVGGLIAAIVVAGCGGGGGTAPSSPASAVAPTIAVQPMAQSVPMGLSASYSVSAGGTALKYQWTRDGAAIPGAVGSTYVTPATRFSDSGAVYAVTVSNPAGSVSSAGAGLTVTARAPMAGDLRFQQVAAATTVSGYGSAGGLASGILSSMSTYYASAIGTGLQVGSGGNCGGVTGGVTLCGWFYEEFALPAATSGASLTTGYASGSYADFSGDLQPGSNWPAFGKGVGPAAFNAVITSLDLEPAANQFAVAWVQSDASVAYSRQIQTVAPADLQGALSQAGGSGGVVTALCADANGQVTYVAYFLNTDPNAKFEAQVVSATAANAPAAAAQLAAAGYIITAVGTSDAAGDLYLVGTRVQGDTMPRPFVAAQTAEQVAAMRSGGYAVVGTIFSLNAGSPISQATTTWIAER